MPTIKMPQAGKSPSHGTIRRWLMAVGEAVDKGQAILEVETDDGLVAIESPIAGCLTQVLATQGQSIPIGGPLAVVGDGPVTPGPQPRIANPAPQASSPKAQPMPANTAAPKGQVIPIVMPKAGQSMEEGTLLKWHVQPGAAIQKGQIIFEIETDKATMEVEATDSGRLSRIVLPESGVCPVLQPVAFLADSDADVDAFLGGAGESGPAASVKDSAPREEAKAESPRSQVGGVQASATTPGGRVKASPAARKVAVQRGVDLAAVGPGSGPGGRIFSTDVPAAPAQPVAAGGLGLSPRSPRPSSAQPAGASQTSGGPPQPPPVSVAGRKRMSNMRKAIARNLTYSKQNIPHFYARISVVADAMIAFYQGEKAKYPCTINDVIVAACARIIREMPVFRCRLEGEEIIELPNVNVGVAVGLDDGLVVPVLVNADALSLKDLAAATKRIVTNARAGKIEAMGQGVFTITNLGMFGVEDFAAIINPPEAAILAVSAAREDVIVSGGTMRPGKVMTLTLSVDHRIVDGVVAAKFLARLKEILESPRQLV